MNIKELLTNKDQKCFGDIWSDERVEIIFKDIDLEKDNRLVVQLVFEFIKYLKYWHSVSRWVHEQITKSEAKKLNAIMKCKTKQSLRKKISAFYGEIQQDQYDWLFFAHKIKAWQNVIKVLQEKENLWEVSPIKEEVK